MCVVILATIQVKREKENDNYCTCGRLFLRASLLFFPLFLLCMNVFASSFMIYNLICNKHFITAIIRYSFVIIIIIIINCDDDEDDDNNYGVHN